MRQTKSFFVLCLFVITFFCILICYLTNYMLDYTNMTDRSKYFENAQHFRNQKITPEIIDKLKQIAQKENVSFTKLLAVAMSESNFDLETNPIPQKELLKSLAKYESYHSEFLKEIDGYFQSVWSDLKYFPVPLSSINEQAIVQYDNSWMLERTFGGVRGHEGTDIMANIKKRGLYPIVSMTDGIVEKIGWLPQGGYRIGIRSPHGGYFYYAHLYGYAKDFLENDTVAAGELLGYMGDSGYSEIEGTVGNFAVHLHSGIYFNTLAGEEISVNPYWILRYLESEKLTYSY